MKYFLVIVFLAITSIVKAQSNIDVIHYTFNIDLNDKNDTLVGWADIKFVTTQNTSSISLDLAGVKDRRGMTVERVAFSMLSSLTPLYTFEKDKLTISLDREFKKGDTGHVNIFYRGIPSDGLIISRSRFGKRTFFSDNWPNRAHKWIPCNDDPSDKAKVEFKVTAPSHYEVVSNGVLQDEKILPGDKKLTHWREDIPLATKIMVIGVADFAIDSVGTVKNIPVTSWVFPENKTDGFHDYGQAKEVLSWFIDYLGPFPFEKLANIQSKTIFGGMENAGAIFYNEDYIATGQMDERLIAHEISHQWFGDMVTEKNFSHLWLSEGFASYLPNIYLQSKYGAERMAKEMEEDRLQVIAFARTSNMPVVDTVSPYMQLLNANSYQKGGWALRMLNVELGDSLFQLSLRNFYKTYAGKNADTRDFQKICEQTSGKNLEVFFQQWLYTPGIPELDIKWMYDAKSKKALLTINQIQKNIFNFPLDILLKTSSGKSILRTLSVSKQTHEFIIPCDEKVMEIYTDPNTNLLFDRTVSRIK